MFAFTEEQASTCAGLAADLLYKAVYQRDSGLFEGKLRVEWRGVQPPDEGRSGRVMAGRFVPGNVPARL